MKIRNFFAELKRRSAYQVAVVAWLLIPVATFSPLVCRTERYSPENGLDGERDAAG